METHEPTASAAVRAAPRRVTTSLALLALTLASLVHLASPAHALVPLVTVNSTADRPLADDAQGCDTGETVGEDPECTLRAAVQHANSTGTTVHIALPPGTYALTIPHDEDETDPAATGSLAVTENLTIAGTGPSRDDVVIRRGSAAGLFAVDGAISLAFESLTLDGDDQRYYTGGGSAARMTGGGSLHLTDVVVRDHLSEGHGGAIYVAGGTATVTGSAFTGNRSQLNSSGAIHLHETTAALLADTLFQDNTAWGDGGAVMVNRGTATITGASFVGNHGGRGGAVAVVNTNGTATIQNSTLSENTARRGGAAIFTQSDAETALDSITIAHSEVTGDDPLTPAAIYVTERGEVTVTNSLLTDNDGPNCTVIGAGSISSANFNFDDDGSCDFEGTADTGGDADLQPLADNGGPTPTHALGPNSDAIDAGDTDLTVDQRGVSRPQGDAPDIGAYELVPPPPLSCDVRWTGAEDNSWHDAGNWDGGEPSASTTVCIDTTTNLPIIHDEGDTVVASLSSPSGVEGAGIRLDAGSLTIAGASTLEELGIVVEGGTLEVDTTLDVGGPTTFRHGILTGAGVTSLSSLAVESGGSMQVVGHDLTLTGETTFASNNPLRLEDGSTVTNHGEVDVTGAAAFSQVLSTRANEVHNHGTIRKTSAGETWHSATLHNAETGRIVVENGALRLSNGATNAGAIEVEADTRAIFVGGMFPNQQGSTVSVPIRHEVGSSVTGEGTVTVEGIPGTTIAGQYDVGRTEVLAPTIFSAPRLGIAATATASTGELAAGFAFLDGPGSLEVREDASFSAGSLSQSMTLEVGGDLTMVGSAAKNLLQGSTISVAGDVLHDGGRLRIATDGALSAAGDVRHLDGIVQLDADAELRAETVTIEEPVQLIGFGAVVGDLHSAGSIAPGTTVSPGTLHIVGDAEFTEDNRFELMVDTVDAFDRVAVDGNVTLDGSAAVTLTADHDLSVGDELALLTTTGTRDGALSDVTLPAPGGGLALSVEHREQAVVLRVASGAQPVPPVQPTPPAPDPDPDATPHEPEACPREIIPPAGFTDLDGNVHLDAIDCLAWYAIAKGIGAEFDPAGMVTRAQVASFVTRLLEVVGLPLPQDPTDQFDDIAGSVHETAIKQLAELGIVRGRGEREFDPASHATRAQAASILAATLQLATGEELYAPAGPFVDTADSVHAEAIDALTATGIIRGKTPTTFEPGERIRRDQFASMLARLLEHLAETGQFDPPVTTAG